jgi:hypothetical protein
VLHDERDGIAAFSATETFEQPFRRRYRKRRGFFVMKGAPGYEIHAAPAKSDKIADNIHYIGGVNYTLYCLLVYHVSIMIFL